MPRQRTYLAVALATAGEHLVDSTGQPVWPTSSEEQLGWLHDIAGVFGVPVKTVRARFGRVTRPVGTVVSIDAAVASAGALYAHLTSRRHRHVASVDEAKALPRPDVIVCPLEILNDDLVQFASTRKGQACGLILATDPEALWRQVLVRSAASRLRSRTLRERVALLPSLNLPEVSVGGTRLLGRRSAKENIEQSLQAGVSLLHVSTHSDGIDAFLSDELILCSTIANLKCDDTLRRPPCSVNGRCIRTYSSIEEAYGRGRLFSPTVISAGVLVWKACSGVLHPASPINPRWGLTAAFLNSSRIGAVITDFGVSLSRLNEEIELADLIASGHTVGSSISRWRRIKGHDVNSTTVLLGDPKTEVCTQRTAIAPLIRNAIRRPTHYGSGSKRNLALFRAILGAAIEFDFGGEERKKLALDSLRAVLAYERRTWVKGSTEREGENMRRTLIAYLRKRGRFLQEWIGYAALSHTGAVSCRECGSRAQVSTFRVALPDTESRQTVVCSRCGIIEDAPAGHGLSLQVNGNRLVLKGNVRKRWAGAALFWSQAVIDGTSLDWPADSNGHASRSLVLPTGIGPGPMNLSLILVHDTGLHYLNCHKVIGGDTDRVQ